MFYRQKNGKITINKNGTMPNSKTCGCCGSSSGSCFIVDCPMISQLHVPPFFTEIPLTEEKPGINTCKVHINGQIYQVDCISSYAEFDDDGFEGGKSGTRRMTLIRCTRSGKHIGMNTKNITVSTKS